MLGWCPQPTLIFSWLLLLFCCFFCWCAPLGTVAASLCCSPSTVCGAVLCCQSRKRREQAKKQRSKERSSGRKGKEEVGCPKMESRNVSFSPFFFFQTESKESDRGRTTEGRRRRREEGKSVVVDKEGGWLRSTLPCRTYTHFSLERERGVVMVAH